MPCLLVKICIRHQYEDNKSEGVSARVIRERFPKEVAGQIQRIAWWDWTREQLEERFDELNDLDAFLK